MDQHERSTLEALPAVNVEVNGQAAALLVKLMGDFSTDKPLAVLTRALGMLEQAVAAKAKGQRLGVYDPKTGRFVLCGTFPGVAPAGCYPAPYVDGARTFLFRHLSALAGAAVRPTDAPVMGAQGPAVKPITAARTGQNKLS